MLSNFKPMLASNATEEEIAAIIERDGYVYVSPKIDGVRAIVRDSVVVGRSLKPIPNVHVQELFGREHFENCDGELIVGEPYGDDVFQRTSGSVRRSTGQPNVTFWIFDMVQNEPYETRKEAITDKFFENASYQFVPQFLSRSIEDVLDFEHTFLAQGYEGAMIRSPQGIYKYGRSRPKQGELLKLKRFTDSEATIIGMNEKMHNANEAKTNELGRTERSSHKENKIGTDTMGALIVQDIWTDVIFNIGTGFNDEQRKYFWERRFLLDEDAPIVKYKFLPVGVKDKPRHPVYLGLRDEWDMS